MKLQVFLQDSLRLVKLIVGRRLPAREIHIRLLHWGGREYDVRTLT
jgi:hypothetical protein